MVRLKEMDITIEGMHCASCTLNVENFLIRLDGIFDVKANLTNENAKILYDKSKVNLSDIEKVINNLGFEVIGIEGQLDIDENKLFKQEQRLKLIRIIVGLIFSVILLPFIKTSSMAGTLSTNPLLCVCLQLYVRNVGIPKMG